MIKYFKVYIGILLITSIATQVQARDDNAVKEIIIKAPIGSGDGQIGYKEFSELHWVEPTAIAIDSKGDVYVADILNDRIQKFNKAGKYLFKIKVTTPQKRSNEYADDITVDNNDNLYILIKNARIIYKYDRNGNLMQTITYGTLLDAEKIIIDTEGQIYLYSYIVKRLYKLGKEGAIESNYNNIASYFLDGDGDLYISKNRVNWEKYNKIGKPTGTTVCDKENLQVTFPNSEGGGCHFPPQFVDKSGYRYFLRKEVQPKKVTSVLIFDNNGKFDKKVMMPFSADIYPQSNLVKFGNDGNFYTIYGHMQEGFQLMRINLR